MDIVTQVLIGLAVFILSAVLIWFISAFSMKEKTFEEVMEEQRREQEKEMEKLKAEKKSEKEKHKKSKKSKQEKVKDKSAPVAVTEPDVPVVKMVQLEIDPEIIEPTETLGLNASAGEVRNRGKKDKVGKSILHNRDDKPLVDNKAVEVLLKSVAPKDELELKKAHEKKPVVEKIEKVQVSETKAAPPSKEKKSKTEYKENMPPAKLEKKEESKGHGKGKPSDESSGPMNAPRVITFVKSAKLSENEVQTLIEILLNKQGLTPSGPAMTEDSWNKKGQKDSVSVLKKQLEDKELALQEEKKMSMNVNARMKDMKSELVSEKSKYATLEKELNNKLTRQKNEMDALHARMQKTHEQHVTETNALQTRVKTQDQSVDKALFTKLADEKKILEDTLSMKVKETTGMNDKLKNAEKELAASVSKNKASEASRKGLESQIKSYESKLKKLNGDQKEVDTLIGKRVEEVGQELRKSEAKNASLSSDLEKATGAVSTAQAEVSTLKAKLQELEAHLTKSGEADSKLQNSERKRQDLEGNLKNLERQLADLTKTNAGKENDVKRLQQENQTLVAENKTVKDRLQAAPEANGDIHDNEKQLSEKNKEVTDLTANLEAQKKSMSSLQVQLDTRQSELDDLKSQLTQQKAKNNELREKNWKAMEALEKAEKTSAEKVDRALKSAREATTTGNSELESYDKAVLQRLFPQVKVADKLQHKDWMSTFEKQAVKDQSNKNSNNDKLKSLQDENSKLKSSISDEAKKYSSLESDNTRLKSEVDNYQSIVSETETKLRQLEKSIDSEEKKWEEKLKQSQAAASKESSSNEKAEELNSVIAQQENQIAEYRNVLAMTENSLKSYEEKIASEEDSWKEKLSSSESELQKAQSELAALRSKLEDSNGSQEDLSDLGFAYRCVEKSLTSIVDELQTKIVTLEAELADSKDKVIVVNTEKETTSKDLQEQLDKERKKNKELSMNTVKLNGIIKTGHDALTQEQALVRKLQEQLETRSVASGISEADEAEQLRIKLLEKQKHLEREMSANKQLSERLAGTAPSKENGTSV